MHYISNNVPFERISQMAVQVNYISQKLYITKVIYNKVIYVAYPLHIKVH